MVESCIHKLICFILSYLASLFKVLICSARVKINCEGKQRFIIQIYLKKLPPPLQCLQPFHTIPVKSSDVPTFHMCLRNLVQYHFIK